MAPPDIPADVRRLIADSIESVAQLEVLLLVRAAPDKRWTPDEVARALVTRPPAAAGFLAQLEATDLVTRDGDGYRYTPPGTTAGTVDRLAECYATRRPTVVGLIFDRPDDAVSSLADAFRIKRRKD